MNRFVKAWKEFWKAKQIGSEEAVRHNGSTKIPVRFFKEGLIYKDEHELFMEMKKDKDVWEKLKHNIDFERIEKEHQQQQDFIDHMDNMPLDVFREAIAKDIEKRVFENKTRFKINVQEIIRNVAYEEANKRGVWGGLWSTMDTFLVMEKELGNVEYLKVERDGRDPFKVWVEVL